MSSTSHSTVPALVIFCAKIASVPVATLMSTRTFLPRSSIFANALYFIARYAFSIATATALR